jgi:hypothetical protein
LAPLTLVAARTGAAIVLIRHLNKNAEANALYRGLGSIGITGLARTVLMTERCSNDSSRRQLRIIKSNLAEIPPPHSYRLVDRNGSPTVQWLEPAGDQAATSTPERVEIPGIVRATLWLLEALAHGPRPAVELLLEAKAHGIREGMLEQAKRQLKIKSQVSYTSKGKRCWLWCPPSEPYVSPLPPLEIELEPIDDPNEDPLPNDLGAKGRSMIERERLNWAKRVLDGRK